jgi:hypothetical protein
MRDFQCFHRSSHSFRRFWRRKQKVTSNCKTFIQFRHSNMLIVLYEEEGKLCCFYTFQALWAVTEKSYLWVVSPCSPLQVNRSFGKSYCSFLQDHFACRHFFFFFAFLSGLLLDPEDWSSISLRKVSGFLVHYMTLYIFRIETACKQIFIANEGSMIKYKAHSNPNIMTWSERSVYAAVFPFVILYPQIIWQDPSCAPKSVSTNEENFCHFI